MISEETVNQGIALKSIFEKQKVHQYVVANTTAKERKKKLKALYKAVKYEFRQEIRDAMMADFRKPEQEVDLSEILIICNEIRHAIHNLSQWMRPRGVSTPVALLGSSSKIYYEPKGVCLIISPWNFPFNLSLGPLVSAIAAGNTVILKPSEMTPHSSAVTRRIVESIFPPEEVYVAEGGIETSKELLDLPFNHIFFTGSPAVGKIVMTAAAKHLSSVTLELGGKSPTIIDETAHIDQAAQRIAWGKHLNAGQICIAPDYIFVQDKVQEEFKRCYIKWIQTFYGSHPELSADYPGIVNKKHAGRLTDYLTDAHEKGAEILLGGVSDIENAWVVPTVVNGSLAGTKLLEEEIFGPVTPILVFRERSEVVEYINNGEKPLALYLFSTSQSNIDYFMKNTRAGGGCINMVNVQFFNHHLPFGGSNNSGIGKSHGYAGFLAFSNERGVLRQWLPGAAEILSPPFTRMKKLLVKFLVDYL